VVAFVALHASCHVLRDFHCIAQAAAWCLRRLLASGAIAQRAAGAGALRTLVDVLGPPPPLPPPPPPLPLPPPPPSGQTDAMPAAQPPAAAVEPGVGCARERRSISVIALHYGTKA